MRTLLVALSFLLAGCAPSLVADRVEAPEGYGISFPGPATTAVGRDGPVEYRIDAVRTQDDARFEAAWFRFPQDLDASERALLIQRIERGLMAPGTRVTSRVELPKGNTDRVDLILDHADGRRGYHRVIYMSSRTMLQISAVGPRGGDWEDIVTRFMTSLDIHYQGPFVDAPVSAALALPRHEATE